MRHFFNNIYVQQKQTPPPRQPPWLRLQDDPRPPCVLVLGDGFTQDFLHAHELTHVVNCGVPNHFPLPESVRYLPVKGEKPEDEMPLWTPELWPRLFAAWEAYGAADVYGFYQSLAKTKFNPERLRNSWAFDTRSLPYELRCYLWHLFRHFQRAGEAELQKRQQTRRPGDWPWIELLWLLLIEFRLSVVSFNYDNWTESVLNWISSASAKGLPHPVVRCAFDLQSMHWRAIQHPANTVLINKVHGSLVVSAKVPFIGNAYSPRPWVQGQPIVFAYNYFTDVTEVFDFDLEHFPLVPDLVPPGHPGDDLCNPIANAVGRAREQLYEAQLVVFCGLSAVEPDTDEVRSLVQNIRSDATVIHMGLAKDRTNDLAKLLDEAQFRGRFFVDVKSEFRSVYSKIAARFDLTPGWS
jgi:hypothetical protein